MCQRIFLDELSIRHIATKFVPRFLSSDQKEYRISVCTELKEQAENDPNLSPTSLLVTNLRCLGMTLRLSSSCLSGRLQLHCDQRKHKFRTMSNNFFFFWHWRHHAYRICSNRTDSEWKIKSRHSEATEGKHPAQTSRQVVQQPLGPASWQCSGSRIACCAADLASTNMTVIPHPPYSPDLTPCDFFPFPKMKLKLKGLLMTALKRSRPYCRMWWRCWRHMTSRSASDHGNPAGIAVSMPKGTTLKGIGAHRNFGKWLSYGRGILGTFGWQWYVIIFGLMYFGLHDPWPLLSCFGS